MAIETATLKTALQFASAGIQAIGAIRQGRDAKANADFEAAQLRQQATRDQEIANQNADDFAGEQRRRRATLQARVAGSGVTLEGTPLTVALANEREAAFQELRIRAGGDTAQAFNQASLIETGGRSARTSGFIRAGASLLSLAKPKSKSKTKTA